MISTVHLSGYADTRELMAQRYRRGGRYLFVVALPILLVQSHLPTPDPDEPFEGNRTVNAKRAHEFADYWRTNVRWATPPLLLDTTYPLSESFEVHQTVGGVDFGVLRLPYNSETELQILDGQHRILGWVIAARGIAAEVKQARERMLIAEDRRVSAATDAARAEVARLGEEQRRLRDEFITVEILEGVTMDAHKQYFHDIATNAKGITKSLTASFDRRNVVNRVAVELANVHPLLKSRVEFEMDTVRGRNTTWLSGKNVVDVVTTLALGAGSSMTAKRRSLLQEDEITQVALGFFDDLERGFADLAELVDGEIGPLDLRDESLLASPTVLRALAGAYADIAVDHSSEGAPAADLDGRDLMIGLFQNLSSHMGLPIEDFWFDTGVFPERLSRAPSSRSQDLRALADTLATWARQGSPT